MKRVVVMFVTMGLIYIIGFIFLLGDKISDSRIDLYKYELKVVKKGIEKLKQDIKRYPTTKEGLQFLCNNLSAERLWRGPYLDGLCKMGIKKIVYYNINNKVILYHMGTNGIDEYTFGDDVREPLPYEQKKNQKRVYFFLFNGIFFGFLLGIIFSFISSRIKRRWD